jgi:hypothetical protein
MTLTGQSELIRFVEFASGLIAAGRTDLSVEEAVELWHGPSPCPDDPESTIAAVREAIADMEAGEEGMPAEEFIQQYRERHFAKARE